MLHQLISGFVFGLVSVLGTFALAVLLAALVKRAKQPRSRRAPSPAE